MKLFLAIAAAVIVAIVAPLFFLPGGGRSGADVGMPWQIEVLSGGGSKVFGLELGRSTLADARTRLGSDFDLAVISAPNETGSLEAHYPRLVAGFVTGTAVLTLAASPAEIEAMRGRALKTEYMESTTRRATLHPDDAAQAETRAIAALAFVPAARLDADAVQQRFGPAVERRRVGESVEHLLYPERGLDVVVDSRGKEVFQYVAPRDFARLRAPLDKLPATNPAQ